MQNHWKSPNSPHKILLSSLARDFVLQKKSFPNQEPRIQIHQNEVHIKYIDAVGDAGAALKYENFQRVLNELTKKGKLYRVKDFDKLSLNIYSCQLVTDESIRCLKKIIIENFSGLKKLTINFCVLYNFYRNVTELISELICGIQGLISLQINLVGVGQVSDESMENLIKRIHRSQKHLKNLSIDISARMETRNSDIKPPRADIFQRLTHEGHDNSYSSKQNLLSENGILGANSAITKYFRTLEELNLSFGYSRDNITDEVCQQLGQGILERMECLKRLTLNFCGCKGLTNEAMTLFDKTEKRKLKALESLTLELADIKIDDIGLELLEEGICLQFKDLKRLVVNLMFNRELTPKGKKGFNKGITQNLQALQAYTLAGYGDYSYMSSEVKAISKDLCKNLKNLKELILMFSKMDITVLPAICADIEKNSLNLEKLSLMLEMHRTSASLNLAKVQKAFGSALKNLVELNLDFSANETGLGNETILELGKSLERLAKLKRLALGFNGSSMIGQMKVFKLGAIVPKTVALERFEAFFMRCSSIGDEHVDDFGASLCEFQKGLRVMHVSFSKCELLTEKSYKKFCRGIKHDMKKLEDLTLNFYDCEKISGDAKTEMKVLLREVPLATLY